MIGPARLAEQQQIVKRALDLGMIPAVFDDVLDDVELAYSTPRYLGTRPEYGPILPYRD